MPLPTPSDATPHTPRMPRSDAASMPLDAAPMPLDADLLRPLCSLKVIRGTMTPQAPFRVWVAEIAASSLVRLGEIFCDRGDFYGAHDREFFVPRVAACFQKTSRPQIPEIDFHRPPQQETSTRTRDIHLFPHPVFALGTLFFK